MIKLLGKIPRTVMVAVSGGVDSMASLDFLSNNHQVSAAFFHHGTENSERALSGIEKYCRNKKIKLIIGHIQKPKDAGQSLEEYWRTERYKFFDDLNTITITAHNLNDCVETWIWSSLNGQPKLIPYQRSKIIRPLLSTSKKTMIDWCIKKNVEWIEDTSNNDIKFTRNYIRHQLMPHALRVNPGLFKLIQKRLIDRQLQRRVESDNLLQLSLIHI